jgi:hypothetical protein
MKQSICNKRLIFLVFIFFLVVNITSSGGHFDVWDGVETFLVTESMVLKHSAKLYPDVPSIQRLYFDIKGSVATNKAFQSPACAAVAAVAAVDSASVAPSACFDPAHTKLEPMYTFRSLLSAAIAVPFYYAALIFSFPPIPVVGLFVNSLIISLICVVVFCFSLEVYNSRKISFVLSLIFGVCSFIWPYNTTLQPQPLQTLCIFTSAYFIYISTNQSNTGNIIIRNNNNNIITTNTSNNNKKAYFTGLSATGIFIRNKGIFFAGSAGLLLGLSVLAHPTSAIVIPGFIAYSFFTSRCNRKTFVSFLMVLAIMLMFISLINYWRFGSIWDFGYGAQSSLSIHNGWEGLVGLIGSTGSGLTFYFPIAILFPLALKYVYRRNKWLFFIATYVFLVFWLYFGTISFTEPIGWVGAGCWGPRYLAPTLPFITLSTGVLLIHFKRSVLKVLKALTLILCIGGFTVNLLGILVWYQYGYDYGWTVDQLRKVNIKAVQAGIYDKGVNDKEVMTWDPSYSPIVLHAKVLTSGFVAQIRPGHDFMSYGLAPCAYDLYLFCKFGPSSMLILLPLIAVLGTVILNEISQEYDPRKLSVKSSDL